MRYLILSDLHANLEALQAVLAAEAPSGFDGVLVLGDLVGYGASPNEVVATIRQLEPPTFVIRGNHDKAACRAEEAIGFNRAARAAAEWTGEVMSAENRRYLELLPRGPQRIEETIGICHGTPRDEDEYLLSELRAEEILSHQEERVVFFGHTHLPTLFAQRPSGIGSSLLEPGTTELDLEQDTGYLLNPGAVGQPRDQDPRAAFMTFDSAQGRATWRRVVYPVAEAQRKIIDAGLPPALAHRLSHGV